MSKIHLISGLVGAGKSTHARALAQENSALYFATDQWMRLLYSADLSGEMDYDWAMERIGRIEEMIWSQVTQLMALGLDAVLDLGLLQKDHRQKFYDLADTAGFDITLHLIEAPEDVRWQRVQKRNQEKGETFDIAVDRQMFDFCEHLFERPEGAELERTQVVDTR